MTQTTIDLGSDSPIALHPETMSSEVCRLIIYRIDYADLNTTPRENDFIKSVRTQQSFSLKQRKFLYNIAFRLHLLA